MSTSQTSSNRPIPNYQNFQNTTNIENKNLETGKIQGKGKSNNGNENKILEATKELFKQVNLNTTEGKEKIQKHITDLTESHKNASTKDQADIHKAVLFAINKLKEFQSKNATPTFQRSLPTDPRYAKLPEFAMPKLLPLPSLPSSTNSSKPPSGPPSLPTKSQTKSSEASKSTPPPLPTKPQTKSSETSKPTPPPLPPRRPLSNEQVIQRNSHQNLDHAGLKEALLRSSNPEKVSQSPLTNEKAPLSKMERIFEELSTTERAFGDKMKLSGQVLKELNTHLNNEEIGEVIKAFDKLSILSPKIALEMEKAGNDPKKLKIVLRSTDFTEYMSAAKEVNVRFSNMSNTVISFLRDKKNAKINNDIIKILNPQINKKTDQTLRGENLGTLLNESIRRLPVINLMLHNLVKQGADLESEVTLVTQTIEKIDYEVEFPSTPKIETSWNDRLGNIFYSNKAISEKMELIKQGKQELSEAKVGKDLKEKLFENYEKVLLKLEEKLVEQKLENTNQEKLLFNHGNANSAKNALVEIYSAESVFLAKLDALKTDPALTEENFSSKDRENLNSLISNTSNFTQSLFGTFQQIGAGPLSELRTLDQDYRMAVSFQSSANKDVHTKELLSKVVIYQQEIGRLAGESKFEKNPEIKEQKLVEAKNNETEITNIMQELKTSENQDVKGIIKKHLRIASLNEELSHLPSNPEGLLNSLTSTFNYSAIQKQYDLLMYFKNKAIDPTTGKPDPNFSKYQEIINKVTRYPMLINALIDRFPKEIPVPKGLTDLKNMLESEAKRVNQS